MVHLETATLILTSHPERSEGSRNRLEIQLAAGGEVLPLRGSGLRQDAQNDNTLEFGGRKMRLVIYAAI